MAAEDCACRLAGGDVPDPGRAIVAGREQFDAIGRELDRVDVAGVAAVELANRVPGGGVPNLGRVIPTAGGDEFAIGRHGRRGDCAVRAEAHRGPTRFGVPKLGVVAADREHVPAIGCEHRGPNHLAESFEIEQYFRCVIIGSRVRNGGRSGAWLSPHRATVFFADRFTIRTCRSADVRMAELPSGEKLTELNALPGDWTARTTGHRPAARLGPCRRRRW